MANTHYQTVVGSGTGTTDWVLINPRKAPLHLAVSVLLSAGATLTYTVQGTLEQLTDAADSSATGISLENLSSLSASSIKAITGPVSGLRLNITSYTSGTATLIVRQAGVEAT